MGNSVRKQQSQSGQYSWRGASLADLPHLLKLRFSSNKDSRLRLGAILAYATVPMLALLAAVPALPVPGLSGAAAASTPQQSVNVSAQSSTGQSDPTADNNVTVEQKSALGSTNTSTSVSVNGEEVTVPQNGTVHKEVKNENGLTVVDVSVNSSHGSNSVNVNTNSSSTSFTNSQTNVSVSGGL